MTELEEANEYIEILQSQLKVCYEQIESLSAIKIHDFRCAALSGFCSLKDSYGDPRDAEDLAKWAEEAAQAMLKIARGES